MPKIVNTHQAEAWNGYEGHHWAEYQDRYDAVNSGFNDMLLAAAALAPHHRVLDVGCGNGRIAWLAAQRAAHVLGVDLSGPMPARARAAATGVPNLTYQQGDAQVFPFPPHAFDVAVSQFGVMFFADPVAAFANIRGALRPGGRLAFLSMHDLGDLAEVFAVFGGTPVPVSADTGPLSPSDPAVIDRVLTGAGFTDVAAEAVEAEQVWGRDVADAAAFIMGWGPVRFALRNASPSTVDRARDAVAAALAPFADGDAVRLRGTARLVTARA
ncbi:class I SAM-dependent methyltransferase [Saccharothrix sp. S26]|uniref:class I SAM-dependent methyltransferase n=1 Tax=Saccharothrix sp. S26 TaxID=2907215 RepID=UPI001F21976B|nr:class I SAM-dependent methyltransferase [Saccharothrix sp. S26]MCE7001154.1 class I SAM-dependent methyltransferase [Saccharothrix sp. S26]